MIRDNANQRSRCFAFTTKMYVEENTGDDRILGFAERSVRIGEWLINGGAVAIKRWRRAAIAIFAVICVLLIATAFFLARGNSMLEKSIHAFLSSEFGVKYTVRKMKKGTSMTDLGGEWWVSLDSDPKSIVVPVPKFQRADQSDLDYFKESLEEKGLASGNLHGYQLYRAELNLGQVTICESVSCNIYVLYSQGNEDLYIGIYRD